MIKSRIIISVCVLLFVFVVFALNFDSMVIDTKFVVNQIIGIPIIIGIIIFAHESITSKKLKM